MSRSSRLRQLAATWDAFGRTDPLWAILSHDDKKGNRWDLDAFFRTGQMEIEEVLARAQQYVPTIAFGRALDFGCGVGRLTQALAQRFESVDGVDIAASMIEQARALNTDGERCRYHLNEAADLRIFADETFDCIYSNLTLQHIPPRLAHEYITELCRVLRAGGALVFDLPVAPRRSRTRMLASRALRPVIHAWHRRIRRQPVMEIFGTAPAIVAHRVGAAGCRVVHAEDSTSAGPDWISRRYCVTR